MANNDLNRSIKIYIDGTPAAQGAATVEAAIQKLEEKLTNLSKSEANYESKSRKLKKELEAKNRTLQNYQTKVKETEAVLNNLSGSSYTKLLAVQAQVRKALREAIPGTTQYTAALEQNRRVTEAVARAQNAMRVEVGCQGTTFGKSIGIFNKYAAVVTAGVAAITGVTLKLNQLREKRDQREDTKADVKALTGLDAESVNWLEQQAVRLSTTSTEARIRIRQSATEILDAYKLVGSAKPELLENKEALASVTEQTLILASASGMNLKDAVDAVTLSMNQYGAEANQAGRFANVMAAGSKYGSAAVESVTSAITKSGVAAASAGIPIEQLVGTIETLAEKGIKDEIAGTGLKKFFLTLQTGADDTNPKIVGLETALDNLQKKQLSAAQIKKQFGEEGYNVASVLINETDKVNYYTKAVTGTVVAMEQANEKSQTAAAIRAQAKNRLNELGMQLMDRLSPSITSVTNGIVRWSNHVVTLIGFIVKHGRVISTLVTAILIYTAAIKAKTVVDRIHNSVVNAGTISVKNFTTALKLNPWGIAIAGIASLISYFTIFKEKTDQATISNNNFNASLEESKAAIDRMKGIRLKDQNRESLNKRQLQELRSQAEQEIQIKEDQIIKETIAMNKAKKAKEGILADDTAMRDKAQRKEAQMLQKEENTSRAFIANARDEIKELQSIVNSIPIEKVPSGVDNNGEDKARKAALKKEKALYDQQQADLKNIYVEGYNEELKTEKQYESKMLDLKTEHLKRIINIAGKGSSEASDAEKQLADMQIQEKKKAVELAIEEEKRLYEQHQRDLQESYLAQNDDNLKTQEDYEEAKEQLAMMHLQRSLDIAGLDADARKQIEEQLLDFKMKCLKEDQEAQKKAEKEKLRNATEAGKKQQDEYKQRINTYKQYGEQVGTALGNILSGQENAMASFADSMIDIVFDVLGKIVEAEIIKATATATAAVARSSAEAFAMPDSVATFGASGAARAAILSGLIMGALAVAKTTLKGLIGGKNSSSNSSGNEESKPTAQVTVRQWASGNYDVIGQDDGKTYRDIPYIGPAPTGIVHRTALISENGAELIINAEDLAKLQRHINYPLVVSAIQDARSGNIPQRAKGNYGSIDNEQMSGSTPSVHQNSSIEDMNKLTTELKVLIESLKNIRAYVVLRDIQRAEELDDRAKKVFTKSNK